MGANRLTPEELAAGRRKGGAMTANIRAREGAQRRAQFLQEMTINPRPIEHVCEVVGVTSRTYRNWRAEHPTFAAAVDAARGHTKDVDQAIAGDFLAFRKQYLGSDTTWFQAQIVEALEDDSVGGGGITLVLFPPEHGKTTTVEDYITWKLSTDKNYRVTFGSESQNHARKALRRVRNRLEIDGPYPRLVADFGPFAPVGRNADYRGAQPWGQDFFDIWGRSKGDERDYSMVALGFGSGIAGSRTDLLVGDDLCSMRNVSQSEKLLETFRQDWLSRPGTKGRTVIIGTRVADGDIYDLMEAADLPDHIVRFKAHDPQRYELFDTPWLWPERYSPDEYAKMRKNVGESAWARNYQQAPRAAGDSTFTADMLDEAANPMRSVLHRAPKEAAGIFEGLDPGFGTNAIVVCAGTVDKLWVLGGRIDHTFTSNQEIFEACELAANEYTTRGARWLHLHIEDKAFQKGLLNDDALKALKTRYGITAIGHTTGTTKYDHNIGIPGMARDFRRGVIEIPGADDDATEAFMAHLRDQLIRWRPHVKGTALTMDLVMALWFAWLWWKDHRHGLGTYRPPTDDTASRPALPWQPTVLPGGLTELPA